MKLLDVLVPTYMHMLGALSAWLAKVKASSTDGGTDALMSAKLAPDMFPLSTQVRFACVQALEGMCRIQGLAYSDTIDVLLSEGRHANEHPGSLADAQARISETLHIVEELAANANLTDPETTIVHALPNGMILDLPAEQYVRDWAIPQFYFHIMTAYAILRSAGTDLGKADFVAHMLPFLRPVTIPSE